MPASVPRMAALPVLADATENPSKESLQNVRRAREFYRYLEPQDLVPINHNGAVPKALESLGATPNLSASMSPYCQLVALRCNARKAMLSFIDRDTMYILAEAYRDASQLSISSTFEFREDPILSSCISMPSKDRVCEMTIRLPPSTQAAQAAIYQVPDMRASRFSSVPVVSGPPYYRFYAGTPITTRDKINIGSLSVMDTEPREGLDAAERLFLAQTAAQIMVYLETHRQAIEGKRSRRMAQCLDAFIAGKRSLHEHTDSIIRPGKTDRPVLLQGHRWSSDETLEGQSSSGDVSSSEGVLEPPDSDDAGSRSHVKSFARAANLLREAFGELGKDGSVVFVSLMRKIDHKTREAKSSAPPNDRRPSATSSSLGRPAPVLASSTTEAPFLEATTPPNAQCLITEELLSDLAKRYPGGNLWSFDDWRASSSEEDYPSVQTERARPGSKRRKNEQNTLQSAFPGARQLLFTPIWNSQLCSFTHAVFVTTELEIRSLSLTTDLGFITSFCSTLMAECSRLDTMFAEKQKDDFVGTISHEMRSPLHGILASAEFLAETELDGFQESLVDTVRSCSHTLLDTINHVLDYSKINTFRKHWQSSNKKSNHRGMRKNQIGQDNVPKDFPVGAPPLLQLVGVTNISIILEEVVDGLLLGQTYSSGVDITDMSQNARGRGLARRQSYTSQTLQFFIDIQHSDWVFLTQPGAIRRIVQNLVGNALKYCTRGAITIKLELRDGDQADLDDELIILTVDDTGCGISPEFLASRLFLPFAQENSLAPGTGLGLSIVHSIVTMLGGTVEVKSTVGKGTTIQVFLPLKRPVPGQPLVSGPHSGSTIASTNSLFNDDLTTLLQQIPDDTTVAVYTPGSQSRLKFTVQLLSKYIQDWFGLELLGGLQLESATIVLVDEEDVDMLLQHDFTKAQYRPAVIVLCSVETRHDVSYISEIRGRSSLVVEFVSKPYGPYKLAKSLCLALEQVKSTKRLSLNEPDLGTIPEQITPTLPQNETLLENVTDNLQEMDLSGGDSSNLATVIQATETFAASQTSQHAQMAITTPSQRCGLQVDGEAGESFPFPAQQPVENHATPGFEENEIQMSPPRVPAQSENVVMDSHSAAKQRQPDHVQPRVLVVDDNIINSKLLETYLKTKRNYTMIATADNGKVAVDTVVNAERPFNIIFMDISMPVMDGFEATRAIREHEGQEPGKRGAMIIALTGLASGRDQSEGFESGCDLYMTKPVSFKQVGKLLDNWEMHQRIEALKKEDGVNGVNTS
jgi:signal transduction histidine kinase/CheY-like chemotaxis protein